MSKPIGLEESVHAQIQRIEATLNANLQRILKNVEKGTIDVDSAFQEIKNVSRVHTMQMEALQNRPH